MAKPESLETVVITGASAGVGRATALEFAKRGARIGLIARDKERLEAAQREIRRAGGEALVLVADVSDAKQVEAVADEMEETFGPIDIWINNAMVSVFSPVKDMSVEDYRRVMEVTYLGTVNGTLTALRRMLPRNRGRVIQVGSALAYRGIPLQSAYCAAKHAVEGFVESLRSELLHDHSRVKVSMVQLPALNTPQFEWIKSRLSRKAQPVPPIFQPEVAARAIYWTARHDRTELYVGLPTVLAIIVNKIAPRWVDRYLARRGYNAQETAEPENPKRPNNLYETVAGDYSGHGRFDERARSYSPELWAAMHRRVIAASLVGAIATLLGWRKAAEPRNGFARTMERLSRLMKPQRRLLAWR